MPAPSASGSRCGPPSPSKSLPWCCRCRPFADCPGRRGIASINAWHLSPLGWMWRPNYFYHGYALHGSNSVPTYAARHGCVRVTVPAMNRAWSPLYIGERLYVYR